jgi:hypothetical protein
MAVSFFELSSPGAKTPGCHYRRRRALVRPLESKETQVPAGPRTDRHEPTPEAREDENEK